MNLKTIAYAALITAASAAFVIGSGGPSEAKGKKKMAAPPPQSGPCFMIAGPVCGAKGGMKFTYANAMLRGPGWRQSGFARRLLESQAAQEGQEEGGQAGEEEGNEAGREEAGRASQESRRQEEVAAATF